MTDYTKNEDYAGKDALASEDPEKLILGTDIGGELDEIATAISTKYDSSDIATEQQAYDGTNNATLMTPLRVAQAMAGQGAGAVTDIVALADPNADRILFWDDSAGAVTWLEPSTGLQLSGTLLSVAAAAVDHDSLLNFAANEHIDHSTVTLTAGEGLSGGGTIAASRSFALDFTELTALSTLDLTNDLVAVYDADATAHKKVALNTLVGTELGDGQWYVNGDQALSAATATTIIFDGAVYDQLTRGTFSTVTGQYTAGSEACRIFIRAVIRIKAQDDDANITLTIQVNGAIKLRSQFYNDTDNDTPIQTYSVGGNLSLAASDVVRVQVTTQDAEDVDGTGESYSYLSIVELA